MEPVTRRGMFLDAICDGEPCNLEPATREEMMLKRLAEGGGGVSSWNDLKDKPFGEEVVSQRTVWHEISAAATSTTLLLKNSENLSKCEGKKVIVTLNGVEYESICLFEDSGEYTISFGEYKILQAVVEMPYAILTPAVNGETYDIKIEVIEKESTVTPIDPKYIILTSPNGTKYNLSVDDDGTLSAVAI